MGEFEKLPERKKLSQYILGNARTFIITFILFTVIVVMTTDVKMMTVSSLADLGFEFFLLMFASYGMYICCADGGIAKGYTEECYTKAIDRFTELKDKIEESFLPRMNEFCTHYVDEELRKTRMQYLSVVCITYDEYLAKYVNLGRKELKNLPELKKAQRKAIRKANKAKRVKLTPERIMTLGRTVHTRSPLSITPDTIKTITFGKKFVKMSFISICMSMIAFEVITQPSWAMFAEVCTRLFTVAINGFGGHKEGFDNITVVTVNYVNNQSSLMKQAIQYIEANPTTEE
jgi:hypothetical protein